MRGGSVWAEYKRPEPPTTSQPTSDRLSAERESNPTEVGKNGSPRMRPEWLVTSAITAPSETKTRSPEKSITSLYEVLRLHGNQLLQSTKRSLIIIKQSAHQKLAAGAASRKDRQKARELAKLRSALLISFPSKQGEQARLRAETERIRKAEEGPRHAEAQAGIRAEQERQQIQVEQARLEAETERIRKAEEGPRHAEAQAGIRAEQERQQVQVEQARLEAEAVRIRKAEEGRRHAEAQAGIRAEQERQQVQVEQARLKAEEETKRKAEEGR